MPNAQYPAIYAGTLLTAVLLASMMPQAGWKAADTSRASTTTLTADPDLWFAAAANATYWLDCVLLYEGGTQGSSDLAFAWNVPAGTAMNYQLNGITTAGAPTAGYARGVPGGSAGTSGAGNKWTLRLSGTVSTGGASGSVTLLWAQNTSNATPTIIHAGSALLARRLA